MVFFPFFLWFLKIWTVKFSPVTITKYKLERWHHSNLFHTTNILSHTEFFVCGWVYTILSLSRLWTCSHRQNIFWNCRLAIKIQFCCQSWRTGTSYSNKIKQMKKKIFLDCKKLRHTFGRWLWGSFIFIAFEHFKLYFSIPKFFKLRV